MCLQLFAAKGVVVQCICKVYFCTLQVHFLGEIQLYGCASLRVWSACNVNTHSCDAIVGNTAERSSGQISPTPVGLR